MRTKKQLVKKKLYMSKKSKKTHKSLNRKRRIIKKTKKRGGADDPYLEFMCPIGHTIMVDPVIASDGHTYERKNIEKWLKIKNTSPLTNVRMTQELNSNVALKDRIQTVAEENERFRNQYEEERKELYPQIQNIAFTNETLREAVEEYLREPTNIVQQHGEIGTWNVLGVTDMSGMFYRSKNFNQPLNDWNVSNVTNMNGMFAFAKNFNQPLGSIDFSGNVVPGGGWDVSNVTDMNSMFWDAKSFNQELNDWNVSNVTDMNSMFGYSGMSSTPPSWYRQFL